MTWEEKKPILARLGYYNFESEDHYNEWFSEQENYHQNRIKKALCQY